MSEENIKLRIDKWLWFARLAKTRSLAAKLVTSGNVRVNKDKASSASRPVKPGDVLTLAKDSRVRIVRVVALGVRRGPAPEAQLLYEDLTPVEEKKSDRSEKILVETHQGRPSKKDRRVLLRMKRADWE